MAKGNKAKSRRDQLRAQAKKARRAQKKRGATPQPKQTLGLGPKPKREILPVEGVSANEYIEMITSGSPEAARFLRSIRVAKKNGTRPVPSSRLWIGNVSSPDKAVCNQLVDKVASLVDENLFGRSEMCLQFASLLARALTELNVPAVAVTGQAKYKRMNGEWFAWTHAWVRYGDVLVDANVDTMGENPAVPDDLDPAPFWGTLAECPADRVFDAAPEILASDSDTEFWWPDLLAMLH